MSEVISGGAPQPLIKDIFDFSAESLGQLRIWLEQNPPGFLISQITGAKGIFPTGCVADYAGSIAPSGFLMCDGSAVSRATYDDLFSVIGTTWGPGDGSTTFNVPDFRGRVGVGKDDMGGVAAGRVTTAGSGINGISLGAVGGAQTVSLTTAQMPSHTHTTTTTVTDPGHSHNINVYFSSFISGTAAGSGAPTAVNTNNTFTNTTGISVSVSLANTGGGSAHNNMPPAAIINKIIKV